MSLFRRVQNGLQMRFYKLLPTDYLVGQATKQNQANITIVNALKERLAHQDGTLAKVDWSNANLSNVILASSRLQNANFSHADLTFIYFAYSDLQHANFESARLDDAHLREANLAHAVLTSASCQRTNFARASLNQTTLAFANLTDANFWKADLRGSNLTSAILTDANIDDVQTDASTILPDGTRASATVDWTRFTTAN